MPGPIERKTIETNLIQKGFRRKDSHHKYFHHVYNGQETGICTYTSHGSNYKDYGISLLGRMKKELRLDRIQDVANLFNCPMDGNDYNDILRSKNLIRD
ncbi:MAG: hypothetical protein V1709_05100 [Planctomycetota bacterium]